MDPIVIDDDDDDDVEIINVTNIQPIGKIKLAQKIELLRAMSSSNAQTPAVYEQFFDRAKMLKPHIPNDIIKSAWEMLYKTYIKQAPDINQLTNQQTSFTSETVIDLTNLGEKSDVSIPSTSSNVFKLPVVCVVQPSNSNQVQPVALFKNPLYHPGTSGEENGFQFHPERAFVENSLFQPSHMSTEHPRYHFELDTSFVQSNVNNTTHATLQQSAGSSAVAGGSQDLATSPVIDLTLPEREILGNTGVQQVSGERVIKINSSGEDTSGNMSGRKRPRLNIPAQLIKKYENKRKRSGSKEAKTQTKMLSKSELKKFKEEQIRNRLEETRDMKRKKMELVHNRLVDVIIPKYFAKELLDKCAKNTDDEDGN